MVPDHDDVKPVLLSYPFLGRGEVLNLKRSHKYIAYREQPSIFARPYGFGIIRNCSSRKAKRL